MKKRFDYSLPEPFTAGYLRRARELCDVLDAFEKGDAAARPVREALRTLNEFNKPLYRRLEKALTPDLAEQLTKAELAAHPERRARALAPRPGTVEKLPVAEQAALAKVEATVLGAPERPGEVTLDFEPGDVQTEMRDGKRLVKFSPRLQARLDALADPDTRAIIELCLYSEAA